MRGDTQKETHRPPAEGVVPSRLRLTATQWKQVFWGAPQVIRGDKAKHVFGGQALALVQVDGCKARLSFMC